MYAHDETVRRRDDRFRDRLIGGVAGDIAHEGTVDLQRVDWKVLDIGERTVAGSEITDQSYQIAYLG